MTSHDSVKAVIYCRVSSAKQTNSAATAWGPRKRAAASSRAYKGYEVIGHLSPTMSSRQPHRSRPGMQAMLDLAASKRSKREPVEFASSLTMSRGWRAASRRIFELRGAIATGRRHSGELRRSEFGEDSDSSAGREHLLATVSQHQRQKNGEQTHQPDAVRAYHERLLGVPCAPSGYSLRSAWPGAAGCLCATNPLPRSVAGSARRFCLGSVREPGRCECASSRTSQPESSQKTCRTEKVRAISASAEFF
jgi:site-specific DNA recombinase